ncbi:HAD hydrolase, family IIID [Cryptococcus wingfieldii CBS 7118]|uniref:HAD hydrolase, family IIID n=1 Tax=Cryptococcus wingfieldii CBS 7118 TaxID=1295528 RepID=A0A1E3J5J1_9TREE|nr:HAD hydrolase, family IIID [Cryptococcus wingfieldii CBS 7118]ODN95211.1 HAD hydrolase, family IIID [Cryptococcus wingfieldii CBS 7118]
MSQNNAPPPSSPSPTPSAPSTSDTGQPPFAQGATFNSAEPLTKENTPDTPIVNYITTDDLSKGDGDKPDFASSIFCPDQSEVTSLTSESKRIVSPLVSPQPGVSQSTATSEQESATEQVPLSPESTKRAKMSHTFNESSSSFTPPPQTSEQDSDGQMDIDKEGDLGVDQEPDSPVVAPVPLAEESEEWWDLKMQWGGKVFDIRVGGNDMVYDFRKKIFTLTSIPPASQKLINLSPTLKGKLSSSHDAMRFATLHIKHNHKFVLVGTPVEGRFVDPDRAGLGAGPEGEGGDGELDVDYGAGKAKEKKGVIVKPEDDPRNKRKIQDIIRDIPITIMNQPRQGKGLLVLDLDYTIVDTKPLLSGALPPAECARPGLHTFLRQVYEHYDVAVWSQTSWRWLEAKLVELGIVGTEGSGFEVSFVCDRGPMFPVFSHRSGQVVKHEVKPLEYIWASYPHWSAKNTVHIDDLSRNFAMNPGSGLKIKAFNSAGTGHGANDRELVRLGEYLVRIATTVDDFTTLDHGVSL